MNKQIRLFCFIFCVSFWLLETANKLDHSFQGEFGTQTVKKPANLASLLPPSQGDEWNVHEVAWQGATFLWERCSSESFGTRRGKCVGVVEQTANDPKSQKNAWSAIGPRMLCRGPAKSPPLLQLKIETGTGLSSSFLQLPRPWMAQAPSSPAADMSSLKESHQGVPLLQLIFRFGSTSYFPKKMTWGELAQLHPPSHRSSFPCPTLQLSLRTQTQCIFIFLKDFLVSFNTHSRHQASH